MGFLLNLKYTKNLDFRVDAFLVVLDIWFGIGEEREQLTVDR